MRAIGSQSEVDESWDVLREVDLSHARAPAAVLATSHSQGRSWWDQLRELGSQFLPAPDAMQPIPLPAAALPFADAAVHPAMPWEDNETWEGLRELELSRAQALAAVVATSQSPGTN